MKLAIVVTHPTQYYSPWFRRLAQEGDLECKVFYLWDFGITQKHDPRFEKSFSWDIDLVSGYDWELVPNRSRKPGTEHFRGMQNPELGARLAAWGPQALLLFGYAYETHQRLIAWARLRRLPLLFRGDSHLLGREQLPLFKRLALTALYSNFAAVTYVGRANRRYFEYLGVKARRLFFAPHSVNKEHFNPERPEYHLRARELRKDLGIAEGDRVVLFAGKMHPDKDPQGLLEAFSQAAVPASHLVMVGSGPALPSLTEYARAQHGRKVHFLPFANQSEMPARYLLADIFCLPSRSLYETWGLAINEAMHMGKPCLVSDLVGCQEDLVLSGKTGWVAKAGDLQSLTQTLARALRADLKAYGKAAAERIDAYTYRQTSAGLREALHSLK